MKKRNDFNRYENLSKKDNNGITVKIFFSILDAIEFSFFTENESYRNGEKYFNNNSVKFNEFGLVSVELKSALIDGFSSLFYGFRIEEFISTLNFFVSVNIHWDDFDRNGDNENSHDSNNENKDENENEKKISELQFEILKYLQRENISQNEFEKMKFLLTNIGAPKDLLIWITRKSDDEISPIRPNTNENLKSKSQSRSNEKNEKFVGALKRTENPDITRNEIKSETDVKSRYTESEISQKKLIPYNVQHSPYSPKYPPFPSWNTLEELRELFPVLLLNPSYIPNVMWACQKHGFTVHTIMVRSTYYFALSFPPLLSLTARSSLPCFLPLFTPFLPSLSLSLTLPPSLSPPFLPSLSLSPLPLSPPLSPLHSNSPSLPSPTLSLSLRTQVYGRCWTGRSDPRSGIGVRSPP